MKRIITSRCFLPVIFLFAFSVAQAQTSLIPQIVDGGPWLTTIALTNTSANPVAVGLTFFQENGGSTPGATLPWNLAFVEMASAQSLVLQPGTTLFLHTLGTALAPSIGWGQLSELDGAKAVVAYAIFTQSVVGRSDQDGTAPAAPPVSRILVPFNNTNGAVTSLAIANPTSSNISISVGIRTPFATTQVASLSLPPQGHMSFDLPTQFTGTAHQTGLVEFYSASGTFSILALEFNSGAFTTAPVYSVTGPPLIIQP